MRGIRRRVSDFDHSGLGRLTNCNNNYLATVSEQSHLLLEHRLVRQVDRTRPLHPRRRALLTRQDREPGQRVTSGSRNHRHSFRRAAAFHHRTDGCDGVVIRLSCQHGGVQVVGIREQRGVEPHIKVRPIEFRDTRCSQGRQSSCSAPSSNERNGRRYL
jgi:hypothetical protein